MEGEDILLLDPIHDYRTPTNILTNIRLLVIDVRGDMWGYVTISQS